VTSITIRKKDKILKAETRLPASKSLSNRALILQVLSNGKLQIKNLSDAGDTLLLVNLLRVIEQPRNPNETVMLDCFNAGTVLRFLTAYLSLRAGKWLLTGSQRMKERPVGPLVANLKQLGANICFTEKEGYPPILIEGRSISGGTIEADAGISSQFISALLMIAPVLKGGLRVSLRDKIASAPYIRMTLGVLSDCGIKYEFLDNLIIIPGQEFRQSEITIEPDWSSASAWYQMAAFADEADILLKDLKEISLQGDSILPAIFSNFGVKTDFISKGARLTKTSSKCSHFQFDFTDHPDLAQAVMATCAGLNIPAEFTGLQSLLIKETDRIAAMTNELTKLGFNISGESDSVMIKKSRTEIANSKRIIPNQEPGAISPVPISTYNDHRMALAFAPMTLVLGSICIENPGTVSKSYPGFWKDIEKAGFNYLSDPG
jgi:3-phosphoshikimate 1-carboxyvinyltransferase